MRRLLTTAAVLVGLTVPALTGAADAAPPTSSFIVVLRPDVGDVPAAAAQLAASVRGDVGFVYQHSVQGFSMTASDAAASALARNPRVAYVERDQQITLAAQETPTGIKRIFATGNAAIDIDGSDDFRVDADVAVIDTGVDFEHPDLNVVGGINCAAGNWRSASCKAGGDDDHYHGTHVAGTVAAIDNGEGVVGVAPGARIHAVKVLDSRGSGYTSWIVAGIDWVAARADTIDVANMSLGGSGFSQAQYDAIQAAVNAGVAFAVAAGNSDAAASGFSPGGFDNVLSVSALADFDGLAGGNGAATCRSDQDDTLADFSNWGTAVDITAPGACILSTYPVERGGYGTISGTSMASPHVAGALALLASSTALSVQELYDEVIRTGNFNWTDDSGDGVKEPLLDVSSFSATMVTGQGGGTGGGTDTTKPVVTITSPADGATFTEATSGAGVSISFAGTATDNASDVSATITWSAGTVTFGTGPTAVTTLPVGTHVVTARATDTAGNVGTASVTVTVNAAAPSSGISLSVVAYKLKGFQYADLKWSGATGNNVDVYISGETSATTTANDGALTHSTGAKGAGSVVYQVCEAGSTTTCSAPVTAVW